MKSYYEMCGIEDGKTRAPILNFKADADLRFFKQKYVVVHIDERPQPGRNVRGISWDYICHSLQTDGYLIVQVSRNNSIKIDSAIQINTIEIGMLAYIIAGCDLFIGVDSGPSHIAVATGRKSIVFFGNVNPKYIHANDNPNLLCLYEEVCEKPGCWHEVIGTTGMDCYIDKDHPPCAIHITFDLTNAINRLLQCKKEN